MDLKLIDNVSGAARTAKEALMGQVVLNANGGVVGVTRPHITGTREDFGVLRAQIETEGNKSGWLAAIDTVLRHGYALAPEEDGAAECELILEPKSITVEELRDIQAKDSSRRWNVLALDPNSPELEGLRVVGRTIP